MLETVGRPVALNPDPELDRIAQTRGWSRVQLRKPTRGADLTSTVRSVAALGSVLASAGLGATMGILSGSRRVGANVTNAVAPEVALALIEAGNGKALASNLGSFEGLDHVEIAEQLIAVGLGWCVAANLDNFEGLDHAEVARGVIAAGNGRTVARNLGSFVGLDHVEVARDLMAAGNVDVVVAYLDRFEPLSHTEIAEALIEAGEGGVVAENLGSFFEEILCEEPDALLVARLFERETVTKEEFQGLLQAARSVSSHEGGPRAVG